MIDRATDAGYLAYQYGDSERLRIRIATHQRFSEHEINWNARFVIALGITPGTTVIDVGCGHGSIHLSLCQAGARVTGLDRSFGMVREARQQAEREHLPVEVLCADAQELPFRDDQFDTALCSHMLYHVPDIRQALTEIKRVVRPGGRALVTTNAADHSHRFSELHAQAAHDLGLTPVDNPTERRFSLDHLPLVRSVFPNVELHHLPNAFVFPTADSALRYYASGRIDSIERRADDVSHREPLLTRMRQRISEIIDHEGAFRVPKNAGCFLATID